MSIQLFAVKGSLHGRSFPIEHQPISIGRGSTNHIVVDDKLTSRRHVEIHQEARGYVLYDLNSSNGTKVNGQQVQSHVLANGDVIVIGEQTFVFQEHQPAQQQHAPSQAATPPQPQHAPPAPIAQPQGATTPPQPQHAPSQAATPPQPQHAPPAPIAQPQGATTPPQPQHAPPAPIAQPQGATTTKSAPARVGGFVSIFGGLLLVATFFMPYIIFTVPLGGLPVNLPVAQLDDVVLALSGMQIIQAAFNVNSLLAGLLVGLPDFVQDAVEPLIEPLLSDIRAHIVWFVLPPISSLLVGIWYILVGGVAAMGLLSGKRVLLTLVRIISFTGSVLVVVALASAYMQRMNILDVSNVFVSLAAGFWVMLVGVLVATAGILFIRAGSSSSI